MKKKILFIIVFTFMMLWLLPSAVALAVTFGFETEDTVIDDATISEANGGNTLQISSDNSTDLVMNSGLLVGTELGFTVTSMSGYVVGVGDYTGVQKPQGTITVSMGGKVFSLESFQCGNPGNIDTLRVSTGETTQTISIAGFVETSVSLGSAFHGIMSLTISWDETPIEGINNAHAMYFDNFEIDLNPIITTQPIDASVASGGNTSFTVAAAGSALTYQWKVDTGSGFGPVSNGGVYSGATSSTLNITGTVTGMNNYKYRCDVTSDGIFTSSTNTATLTVLAEAPTNITLDNSSIAENTASGVKVGGLTTTDSDSSSFTYSLVDVGTYPDNVGFTISGSDLLLNTVPNYEAKPSYSICVQTEDATHLTFKKAFTVTITDVNETPTNITLSNASINENSASGTGIGTLTGTDPDAGAVLSYSLPDGVGDNASFSIDGTILKLNMVPDYETKSSYSITARVNDGTNNYDKVFTISITNVNEAPTGINITGSEVMEHIAAGTIVGTFSGVDPDALSSFTYSLVAGEGDTYNAKFTLDVAALKLNFVPDYEILDSYSIRVRVSDGSFSFDQQFIITINDGNDPPTDITITSGSVAENSALGATAGTLGSTDPNTGDTFTYSKVAGAGDTDNASFSITGDVLKLDVSADYEAKNSYSIRIRTTDNNGLSYEKALTITITNVNEIPTDITLSNNTIAENSAIGTTIGILSGTDPDAGTTLTCSLPAVGDYASFTISGTSLKLAAVPDYETKNSYSITVRVSDGSLFYDEVFAISITDADDAPTDITLSSSSVLEHCAIGTPVGTLGSTDQDGGVFNYTLVAGAGATDNASFIIAGSSLQVAASPNYEVKDSYSIRIRTTDSTALSVDKVFTINVEDGDDPPTDISITSQSIAENSASGTTVGTLSSIDTNGGTFTYSLVSGAGGVDNSSFTITDDLLKLAVVPNYEVMNSYSIRVRTTDGTGFYYEKAITITISNVNEAPTDITLSSTSVAENTALGTTIGTLTAADPDAGSSFTYSLVTGTGDTDNASFTISDSALKLAIVPDYETNTSHAIRVRVSDGAQSYDKQFTITVIDGNDAPTDIGISSTAVDENTASGTPIATLSTIDPNGGSFTYSLVSGAGSTDNSSFTISGSDLKLAIVPDYEAKTSYEIRIRTTDDGAMFYEEAFVITISNLNEIPTDITLSNNRIAENSAGGTAIGTLAGTDPDAGSTYTYSLVSGTGDTDNVDFTILGDTLQTAIVFNFESKNTYNIRIRVTDAGGLWYEKQFTISIDNVNEAPTNVNLSSVSIAENSASGTSVGNLTGTDPDAGATFTYSLVSGSGDTDNSSFTITGNELKLAFVPDYETKTSYDIRVRVSDGALTFEKQFTITIIDGNEAPTDIGLSGTSIDENSASGTTIATTSSTDVDSVGFTYSFVSGTGSTDNASFTISGNELKLAAVPDYEAKQSYNIRICTTDNGGLSFEKTFVISINDMNEAPTNLTLSSDSIEENKALGTTVGTLVGTDGDAGSILSYSLASGTGDMDNACFTISGNGLKTASALDYETKNNYSVRIRVTDAGGLYFDHQFTIFVVDVNETPTNVVIDHTDVVENTSIGTAVGSFTGTDADAGDSITYTLVAGTGSTDNSSFNISGNELKLSVEPNFEGKDSLNIRIRATDAGGLSFEKQFVITVLDINETPTDITISKAEIAENTAINTTVGTLAGADEDTADSLTYTFVTGTGSDDNDSFTLSGNELKIAVVPDYETKNSYSILISATDIGGLHYEKQFTIMISKVNIIPPAPTPTVEKFTLDVTNGATDDSLAQIEVERTTASDGTISDDITFEEGKAEETIEKLKEEGSEIARIIAPEAEGTISEVKVTIPTGTLDLLSNTDISLELETKDARISIPSKSLETASEEMKEDLYFKVTPVKDEEEKQEVTDRAKKDGMLIQMLGNDLSLIGSPMEIETNMPESTVEIVLPLTGVIIPKDEKEREEFLSKLAVYVEHSDGEKEVIRGEIVEYKEGVYGLKFSVSKFSTFTIIKDERVKSSECKVLIVKTPSDTKINGYLIISRVSNSISTAKLSITVSEGATWKLYSDKTCTKEIKNKVKLKVGLNKVYIKVTAEDGVNYRVYTVYIFKKK